MIALEKAEDGSDLFPGHDDGQPSRRSCPNGTIEADELSPEYFPVEKDESRERLVLGGSCDVSFDREVGEELNDLGSDHFVGMSNVVIWMNRRIQPT